MDVEHLRTLIEAKSGESLAERDERALVPIKDLLRHPDVADYLQYCLPRKPYLASGITVNDLTGIIAMMHPKASPGGSIRSYGYVVVGDSVGGNAICFQTTTGRVFWADHESFLDETIAVKDLSTKEWTFLNGYSAEDVQRAMVPLFDDIQIFLVHLLKDELEERFDALDT